MSKLLLVLLPISLSALEMKPWFGDLYEFYFTADYTYSRYNKVDNAHPPLKHPSNDQLIYLGLEFSPSSEWDADIDLEFVNTPRQSWGYRSFALQVRRLWLDENYDDPLSVTTGFNFRNVNHLSLTDISCPYATAYDFEMNLAIGKEWCPCRIFALGAIGIGTGGATWAKAHGAFEGNWDQTHRYEFFVDSLFGFGADQIIHIEHFHSYAHIHYQAVDLGLAYTYATQVWGNLSFSYAHRVYAQSFPANTNFFMLSYTLPFSLF